MSTDLTTLDEARKILAQKIDADLEQVCIDDLKELFRQGVLTIQKTPTQYHIDYQNDKMQIQQAFSARLCWVGREKIEKLEAQNKRLREELEKEKHSMSCNLTTWYNPVTKLRERTKCSCQGRE